MARPVEVKALPNFRIWLRYDDGTTGDVDLSDLVGRGVFNAWHDIGFFNSVKLGSHGAIEWGSDLDICPDAGDEDLPLRVRGIRSADCHRQHGGDFWQATTACYGSGG